MASFGRLAVLLCCSRVVFAEDDFTPYSHNYALKVPEAQVANDHESFAESDGVIGLAVNGIPFVVQHYDMKDGLKLPRGMEHEFDDCGGHGDTDGHYHYHFAPTCLLKSLGSAAPRSSTWWHGQGGGHHWPQKGKSVKVGVALDGMAILGPYHPSEQHLLLSPAHDANSPLDACHGMQLADGQYAYFLTATAPFLPPCLRYSPGVLEGYSTKLGECQKDQSTKPAAGCPDHPWFRGSTSDEEAATRQLAGTHTAEGFLADILCVNNGVGSMSRANLTTEPWKHTKDCMLMQACIESGFGLLGQSASNSSMYELKYKLDASGNTQAVALLRASCSTEDIYVKVTGTATGTTLAVAANGIQEITSGMSPTSTATSAAKCGTTTAKCGTTACGTTTAKCGTTACGTTAKCGTTTAKCGTTACGTTKCGTTTAKCGTTGGLCTAKLQTMSTLQGKPTFVQVRGELSVQVSNAAAIIGDAAAKAAFEREMGKKIAIAAGVSASAVTVMVSSSASRRLQSGGLKVAYTIAVQSTQVTTVAAAVNSKTATQLSTMVTGALTNAALTVTALSSVSVTTVSHSARAAESTPTPGPTSTSDNAAGLAVSGVGLAAVSLSIW